MSAHRFGRASPRSNPDHASADRERPAAWVLLVWDRDAPAGVLGDRLDSGRRTARRRAAAGQFRVPARAPSDDLFLSYPRYARGDDARAVHDLVARPGSRRPRRGARSEEHGARDLSVRLRDGGTAPLVAVDAREAFFSVLLLCAAIRMVLSGIYEVGGGKGVYQVSGGFALALAALAMYGGVALGLEDAHQRE